MGQWRPGSLKDDKKPAMGRAGGRVFQLEELHGGQAPGSLREGWREDPRLECGEQTGRTGQAGRQAGGPWPTERQDRGGLAAARLT